MPFHDVREPDHTCVRSVDHTSVRSVDHTCVRSVDHTSVRSVVDGVCKQWGCQNVDAVSVKARQHFGLQWFLQRQHFHINYSRCLLIYGLVLPLEFPTVT